MRKVHVVAAFAFAVLGMLAPVVFAQAPAPKVTITGLFDQTTAASANVQDGSFGRTSDREWYARTRFRPDFEFAVGRTKAVMGFEIDLTYGDFAGLSTVTTFDPTLNLKIAYVMVEDEIAGGNRGTAGGGLTITTGAAAGAALGAPTGKTTRGNDFAFIISPELTPMKGLDIKPLYSLFYAEGLTSGTARRAAADVHLAGGTNGAASYDAQRNPNGSPAFHENRHTLGFDAM